MVALKAVAVAVDATLICVDASRMSARSPVTFATNCATSSCDHPTIVVVVAFGSSACSHHPAVSARRSNAAPSPLRAAAATTERIAAAAVETLAARISGTSSRTAVELREPSRLTEVAVETAEAKEPCMSSTRVERRHAPGDAATHTSRGETASPLSGVTLSSPLEPSEE